MDSLSQRQSFPGVTAAGVVAILLSLLGAFGAALSIFSLLVMPEIQRTTPSAAMVPQVRAMTIGLMVFFLALSIFGIFVGVAILRRKNWARITILIWGAFMTVVCLFSIAVVAIMGSLSSMTFPSTNTADTDHIMQIVKIVMAIVYGVPAVIGIWWLILFTRPRVAAAFTIPLHHAAEMDPSGFPQLAGGQPAQATTRPSCPVPIIVIAVFLIVGAVGSLSLLLFPFPAGMPLFFLGHPFEGVSGRIVFLLWGIIGGAAGVGLLKLKPWALHFAIGLQSFALLNCAITFLSPSYLPAMRAALEKMSSQNSAFAGENPVLSSGFFESIMVLTTLLAVVLLVILFWQRSRFLEAAAAAKA